MLEMKEFKIPKKKPERDEEAKQKEEEAEGNIAVTALQPITLEALKAFKGWKLKVRKAKPAERGGQKRKFRRNFRSTKKFSPEKNGRKKALKTESRVVNNMNGSK